MRKIVFIIAGLLLYTSCVRNDKKNSLEQVEPKTVVDTNTIKVKEKSTTIVESKQRKNSLIDSLMVLGENRTFQEYKGNIKLFFEADLKNDSFSHKSIEGIIPTSSEEYFYYYSFSYPDKDIKKFDYIEGLIVRNALMNKGNVLKLYSNMAEFVDGEYADNFFGEIEDVVQYNSKKFCGEIYNSLSTRSKERLTDIYDEYCESIPPLPAPASL